MILRPVMQYSFNPRTPRGVRPGLDCPKVINYRFQSTHPARGATGQQEDYHLDQQVSIHAPREGCDVSVKAVGLPALVFQSTHPARGATYPPVWMPIIRCSFNPRTPRGVRPLKRGIDLKWGKFQSTHPARGATVSWVCGGYGWTEFQSTHPARGATACPSKIGRPDCGFNPRTPRGVRLAAFVLIDRPPDVSIHAPREGCDLTALLCGTRKCGFNPRTPRGVRRSPQPQDSGGRSFNPRTPRGVRRGMNPPCGG